MRDELQKIIEVSFRQQIRVPDEIWVQISSGTCIFPSFQWLQFQRVLDRNELKMILNTRHLNLDKDQLQDHVLKMRNWSAVLPGAWGKTARYKMAMSRAEVFRQ